MQLGYCVQGLSQGCVRASVIRTQDGYRKEGKGRKEGIRTCHSEREIVDYLIDPSC
jgi:hypothetical protein